MARLIGCLFGPLRLVVSLMTEEPDEETQRMVDETRIPKGKAILSADH